MANESDGLNDEVKANLIKLCQQMDLVRIFLGQPITVHVTYRPEEYNKLIGGASNSAHKYGMAMDWSVDNANCAGIRDRIRPQLEMWNLRMEKGTPTWIHLDTREVPPGGNREFNP